MPADRAGNSMKPQTGLEHAFREDWAARRLHLEYQPQVDLARRQVVRFEALLRWDRAAAGIVPPKEFIPLAESLGLIVELGQWVLQRACADAVAWPAEIGVAVNLSAASLHDPALPALVRQALAQSGLPAARLELEITEHTEIEMIPAVLAVLHEIRGQGVRLTIDDVDVGFSSLRYLLDFPFDKIKLDALYTVSLGQASRRGEAASAIVGAISQLCRSLHIDSLAEGVETPEQLVAVINAGISEVQGFIFGESVPADKIHALLRVNPSLWPEAHSPAIP